MDGLLARAGTSHPKSLDDPGVAGIETLGAVIEFALHATRQQQGPQPLLTNALCLGEQRSAHGPRCVPRAHTDVESGAK